jgi:nucleoid DNA-binding protein
VGKTLTDGEDIFLRGLGTFQSHTYRARKGRNITQNRTIDIPARRSIRFKPSGQLRNLPLLTDE